MGRFPHFIYLTVVILALSFGNSANSLSQQLSSNNTENLRGWIPLPGLGTANPGAGAGAALTVADNVALLLINSIRATFQAPAVTYSAALKTAAATCAQQYVVTNPGPLTTPLPRPNCVGSNAGVAVGANVQTTSNGVRSAIQDTCSGSWFFQWINNQVAFPPAAIPAFGAAYQDFTQMIWVASSQVGCAFSPTTVMVSDGVNPATAQFIYICLWSPAGNIPSDFVSNIREDV